MKSSTRDPLLLNQWLSQTPSGPGDVLSRARRLEELNRALRDWSSEAWITQIRLVNIRGETLVLYSASAAALIPLRTRSGALLAWLNDRYQLGCTRLETRVRPPTADA
ncbi:MAG TPA: hypothetical protein VFV11_03030 [Solimonas sp.]|nr:hypothetical protein [Solimonas sp.]